MDGGFYHHCQFTVVDTFHESYHEPCIFHEWFTVDNSIFNFINNKSKFSTYLFPNLFIPFISLNTFSVSYIYCLNQTWVRQFEVSKTIGNAT